MTDSSPLKKLSFILLPWAVTCGHLLNICSSLMCTNSVYKWPENALSVVLLFYFLNSPTVINQEPIQILSVHGADVMRHRNLCISLFVFIFHIDAMQNSSCPVYFRGDICGVICTLIQTWSSTLSLCAIAVLAVPQVSLLLIKDTEWVGM